MAGDVEDDVEREEPDSGPFCRHWSDPSDCDILCKRCGHRCFWHGYEDNPGCDEAGCECPEWVEP